MRWWGEEEKRRLKAENKAKKLAKKKQQEFLEAESALNEAKKLAEQKEQELRKAEILLIREDYDMPPKKWFSRKVKHQDSWISIIYLNRLLKCDAVKASQSNEKICRLNTYHIMNRKEVSQDTKRFSIGGVIEYRNQDNLVGNIEICIACR